MTALYVNLPFLHLSLLLLFLVQEVFSQSGPIFECKNKTNFMSDVEHLIVIRHLSLVLHVQSVIPSIGWLVGRSVCQSTDGSVGQRNASEKYDFYNVLNYIYLHGNISANQHYMAG